MEKNPNPTKKQQSNLQFVASCFNIVWELTLGKIFIRANTRDKFQEEDCSKAIIDATNKKVVTTVKGKGVYKVNEDTVDWKHHSENLPKK